MSQVNLLPPELRQKQAERRLKTLVVGIGVAVIALLVGYYFLQGMKLSSTEDELAQQQQTNAELQAQIQELQPYLDLQSELRGKEQLTDTVYQNEVSWAGVLLDVSRVIPDESYLTSLTGAISVPTGTPAGLPADVGTVGLIGNVTFAGVALETETIASWLTRLEQVRGWVNPWVNDAAETAPFTRIYAYTGGLDLTVEAATPRGRGGTKA